MNSQYLENLELFLKQKSAVSNEIWGYPQNNSPKVILPLLAELRE